MVSRVPNRSGRRQCKPKGKPLMPEKRTVQKALAAKREGKAPSTQAGAFVHEEIDKIRSGEHGARSTEQAIAIGLSKARRAGVDLPPPQKGRAKENTRKSAEYAYEVGQHERQPKHRPRVARAVRKMMQKEPQEAASHEALSRHTKKAALRRKPSERSAAAKKAAVTKGAKKRSDASRKAARTRKRRASH
jgi:hypothetical protein